MRIAIELALVDPTYEDMAGKFFEHFPDDLRPGWRSRFIGHFSTAVEGLVPLVLIVLFCLDWYRRGGREHARSSSTAVVGA